jgi:hypothetical protein
MRSFFIIAALVGTYATANAAEHYTPVGAPPICEVDAQGITHVFYVHAQHPSFKCTHSGSTCACTLQHPTHHKGGCKQLESKAAGKILDTGGDCTDSGKNTAAPTPAPALTYTKVSNQNCEGASVGSYTADCQVGTKPTCSGDKYKCYNAQGAGYYNWEWGSCWMKTLAQAEAVCEKYRNGLTTANVREGGQITFNACNVVVQDGGGYTPRICKSLSTWSGVHTFISSNW